MSDIIVEVEGLGELQFPDGTDPSVIQATVKRLTSAKQPEAEKQPEKAERGWGDTIKDALPTIGGTIGGLAGGTRVTPAGTALAGMGGAVGQGVSELIDAVRNPIRKVDGPIDALKQANAPLIAMARAGAEQAGLQYVGGKIGNWLSSGAGRLYQGLAKPAKALRADHPDLIQTALRERIPLTSRGATKVDNLTTASRQQADNMIAQAQAAGAGNVPTSDVVSELAPVVTELRKRALIGQPNKLHVVGDRARNIVQASPRGIPLTQAQELKRTAQNAAQGAFRQVRTGAKKEMSADDLMDKAIATGFRKGIEKKAPDVIPVNQRTQSLGGVREMVGDALERGKNANVIGMSDLIGAGAGGALGGSPSGDGSGAMSGATAGLLLTRLLNRQSTGSTAAILVNEAARLGLPVHVLRALVYDSQATEQEE